MLKRFIFIIYLLLAILPLQSIASASMIVCNSMMTRQSQTDTCHQHHLQQSEQKNHSDHTSSAKLHCVVLCASLCATNAIGSQMTLHLPTAARTAFIPLKTVYASISLPSLLRPPIAFS